MPLHHGLFLFAAALAAGALNSVAGGGGFIAFPALLFTGMAPINANATNTAALWPGTVASTGAYRRVLGAEVRRMVAPLVITGLVGGLIGALVLLHTPQPTFMRMVPWMLLSATLLFVFSRRITVWVKRRSEGVEPASRFGMALAMLVQFGLALYIGFFGAGAGIVMLAMFALMGVKSIHTMNGLKTLLASVCNGMALLTFVLARAVVWPHALLMLLGAAIGGYGGAWYAQRIAPEKVRVFAIAVGFAMSAYFFAR